MQQESVERASSSRQLEIKEALQYLDQVKAELVDKPLIYNEFLTVMKFQSANTRGVIERVTKLFSGYDALLAGFNNFLPKGYKIEVAVETSTQPLQSVCTTTPPQLLSAQAAQQVFSQAPLRFSPEQRAALTTDPSYFRAVDFVNIIKNRFPTQPHVFREFLLVLRAHSAGTAPIDEVLQRMAVLFADNIDLFAQFIDYLATHNREKEQECDMDIT